MIVTFYSFKGGVGRSMALGNVARDLQLAGQDVTLVDWDLEAPGLESYFVEEDLVIPMREHLGLLDVLLDYIERHDGLGLEAELDRDRQLQVLRSRLPPIAPYLQDIAAPGVESGSGNAYGVRPGRLRLLGAGYRDESDFAEYANAVQEIDWEALYDERHGLVFFDWLREQLHGTRDEVVLIDSRTGVTEMGGVCTRQMADLVVALVAPNRQNLQGSEGMVRSFKRESLLEERQQRRLEVLMVPARIDRSASVEMDRFKRAFATKAGETWPILLQGTRLVPWDLHIPYIPKYAYEEQLTIGAPDCSEEMSEAYMKISTCIAAMSSWGSPLARSMHARIDRWLGPDFEGIKVIPTELIRRTVDALSRDPAELLAYSLLLRFAVLNAQPSIHVSSVEVTREFLDVEQRSMADRLVNEGILKLTGEGARYALRVPGDDLIDARQLAKYVSQSLGWLLWRQRLGAALNAWLQLDRNTGALLPQDLVPDALRRASECRTFDLLEIEREFIAASERFALHQRSDRPGSERPAAEVEAGAEPPDALPMGASGKWSVGKMAAALVLGAVALLAFGAFAHFYLR